MSTYDNLMKAAMLPQASDTTTPSATGTAKVTTPPAQPADGGDSHSASAAVSPSPVPHQDPAWLHDRIVLETPLITDHLGIANKGLNNNNRGGGVEYRFSENDNAVFECFRNSLYRETCVAGIAARPLHLPGDLRAGVTAGVDLTNGYPSNPFKPLLADLSIITDPDKQGVGASLEILPASKDERKGVAVDLSLRYTFGPKSGPSK